MYLNEQPEDIISANDVTEQAMGALFSMVIEPMRENLDMEDLKLIDLIGVALKAVGEKATLYEDMIKNGHDSNYGGANDFSRN